jgi:hypothetical protein
LEAFSAEYGITFPLLSDPDSEIITRYGLLNTVADAAMDPALGGDLSADPLLAEEFGRLVSVTQPDSRFQGIAIPGTFILDTDGRVVERFFEDFYRDRNTVANIMLQLGTGEGPVQAQQVTTNHLELTTWASDREVARGNRFALVFDVDPVDGIHVYAPGDHDYRVIGLRMDGQPFVSLPPVEYPPSEIYYFEPFNERVPVYESPFRLVQEVVVEATPEADAALRDLTELTLTGTLEYQACDDAICYNPVAVPLSWNVALRPYAVPQRRN